MTLSKMGRGKRDSFLTKDVERFLAAPLSSHALCMSYQTLATNIRSSWPVSCESPTVYPPSCYAPRLWRGSVRSGVDSLPGWEGSMSRAAGDAC